MIFLMNHGIDIGVSQIDCCHTAELFLHSSPEQGDTPEASLQGPLQPPDLICSSITFIQKCAKIGLFLIAFVYLSVLGPRPCFLLFKETL